MKQPFRLLTQAVVMERNLVVQAMHGDRSAFAALASAHVDHCYALAYRILRDPHRAEDASQQALLGAWRDLPGLRDPDRFEAWLRRLVVHACYTQARSDRRWSRRVRLLPVDEGVGRDDASAVDDRDEIERALRRLTPEQRAVVVLHHHVGLTSAEIAETLGIPAGTARSRLHHAHRELRAVIEAARRAPHRERSA